MIQLAPSVEAIKQAIDSGEAHRAIARRFGVSRQAVARIRSGKSPAIRAGRRGRPRTSDSPEAPRQELLAPVRCPGCGGMIVVVPCLKCEPGV